MFFAPQTSFIPVTVALARYIEAHGFSGNYPYWYLSSTPIKFLTGPIVPSILVGLHKIFPNLSFFDLSYLLLVTSFLLQALGWGLLVASLSGKRIVGWWVGGLMLFAPWNIFWTLSFGEVSVILANSLTPWVLLGFLRTITGPVSSFLPISARSSKPSKPSQSSQPESLRVYPERSRRAVEIPLTAATRLQFYAFPAIAFAILLLVNTTASIPALIGLAIVGIVTHKRWETGLKHAAVVVISGFILTLWWYSPSFWLTIAGASSFGGRSALGAFAWVVDMFRGLVPVILAIAVVLLGIRPKDTFAKFTYAWLGIFGILTLIRFIANPAFWLDWTAWVGEVEVGVVLILSQSLVSKKRSHEISADSISSSSSRSGLRPANSFINRVRFLQAGLRHVFEYFETATFRPRYMLLVICYFVLGYLFAFQNRHFWLPRKSIETSVEYRISNRLNQTVNCSPRLASLDSESERADEAGEPITNNCPTVFLSGLTAFWLNSLFDVRQVRGGRDEASRDKNWQKAAWEIRQGSDPEESEEWLRSLNIKYLVIHTEESQEFYHDFENIEKFSQIKSFEKVYEKDGDVIYMMNP